MCPRSIRDGDQNLEVRGASKCFDGQDVRVLLEKSLGDPIGGGIIAYDVGGRACIAVSGGMTSTVTQQTDSGPAWVSILSLPR